MSKLIVISRKSSTAIPKPLSSKSANLDLQTEEAKFITTIFIKPTSKVHAAWIAALQFERTVEFGGKYEKAT
jgi:hypothetical protein